MLGFFTGLGIILKVYPFCIKLRTLLRSPNTTVCTFTASRVKSNSPTTAQRWCFGISTNAHIRTYYPTAEDLVEELTINMFNSRNSLHCHCKSEVCVSYTTFPVWSRIKNQVEALEETVSEKLQTYPSVSITSCVPVPSHSQVETLPPSVTRQNNWIHADDHAALLAKKLPPREEFRGNKWNLD